MPTSDTYSASNTERSNSIRTDQITDRNANHTTISALRQDNPTQNNKQDQWIGDPIVTPKPNETVRIMFHNVNGIGSQNTPQNTAILINEQISTETDIMGITEHCINTNHKDIYRRIQDNVHKTIRDKTLLHINASTIQTESAYLPGGTAISLVGNTVGRVEPKGRGGDPMGRWSFAHLRRKNQKPITIITAYQVNIRPTNEIGSTAWHQQRLLLNQQQRTDIHPRQAFIHDLMEFVQTLHTQKHDIIIGGDFNETADKANSGLLKLMTTAGLVDPIRLSVGLAK